MTETSNLKNYLKKEYENNISEILEEEEIFEPLWETFWLDRPLTKEGEIVDVENFEILSMSDDEFILCAGGDWQTPIKFKLFLDNGEIKTEKISDTFGDNGITDDDFIAFLFDVDLSDSDWYEYFESL